MTEDFTINLPRTTQAQLIAYYDSMVQKAIETALEDLEHYRPMVRMSGLCRWLGVSTTTITKWQRQGMPHMVIDGVTLYDKQQVAKWLNQFGR